jgi:hypothetical protein
VDGRIPTPAPFRLTSRVGQARASMREARTAVLCGGSRPLLFLPLAASFEQHRCGVSASAATKPHDTDKPLLSGTTAPSSKSCFRLP